MRIDVHRDINTAMTEQFLYQFGVRALAKKDSSGAMSQIVQAHAWKSCMLEQPMELCQQGIWVEIAPICVAED